MNKIIAISIFIGLLIATNLFSWYQQEKQKQKFESFCNLLNSDELNMFSKQELIVDWTNLDVTNLSYYDPNDLVYIHNLDSTDSIYKMSFESLFQNVYASPSQYKFKRYSLIKYPVKISLGTIFVLPSLRVKYIPIFEYIESPNSTSI